MPACSSTLIHDRHEKPKRMHGALTIKAEPATAARWGPVCALMLRVSTLIASEFVPASLLTPIASDLRVTKGAAGQAISAPGLFAVAASLRHCDA